MSDQLARAAQLEANANSLKNELVALANRRVDAAVRLVDLLNERETIKARELEVEHLLDNLMRGNDSE